MKDKPGRWQNRAHFCAIAAHSMRQILIERARARDAQKRGGERHRVTLDEGLLAGGERSIDLLALDEALERLAAIDRRAGAAGGAAVLRRPDRSRKPPKRWTSRPPRSSATGRSRAPGWRASWRATRRREPRPLAADQRSLPRRARARRRRRASAFLRERDRGRSGTAPRSRRRCSTATPGPPAFSTNRRGASPPDLHPRRSGRFARRAAASAPTASVEEIGRGGMGVVYAAEDERLGRTVALKALTPEYTRDPVRRERLTREARAAAALSHPAIATVFALEEIDGELYIVSELVRGRTLARGAARTGRCPPAQLLSALIDIATALAAAHERGHRPSRSEAGEHHPARRRADQGARLRPGAERRRRAMRRRRRG